MRTWIIYEDEVKVLGTIMRRLYSEKTMNAPVAQPPRFVRLNAADNVAVAVDPIEPDQPLWILVYRVFRAAK